MLTAIQVVWWIGLIGALVLTLVILREVFLILNALRGIHRLAGYTHEAARGIASNVAVEDRLQSLGEPLNELGESVRQLRSTSEGFEQRMERSGG